MTLTVQCPRCDALLSADDDDDLVLKVQTHVRDEHKLGRALPRKHVLHRQRAQTTPKR